MSGIPVALLPWLQMLGILIGWTVLVFGIHWKVKGRPLERNMDELLYGSPGNPNRRAVRVEELNRVGEVVNDLKLGAEQREARVRAVEGTVRDQSKDVGRLQESMGRVTTWMETCSRDTQEMKHEIIGFISKRTDEISRQVQDVEVKVAVVKERVDAIKAARDSAAMRKVDE